MKNKKNTLILNYKYYTLVGFLPAVHLLLNKKEYEQNKQKIIYKLDSVILNEKEYKSNEKEFWSIFQDSFNIYNYQNNLQNFNISDKKYLEILLYNKYYFLKEIIQKYNINEIKTQFYSEPSDNFIFLREIKL